MKVNPRILLFLIGLWIGSIIQIVVDYFITNDLDQKSFLANVVVCIILGFIQLYLLKENEKEFDEMYKTKEKTK